MEIKYKFYATLLDKFQNYIGSSEMYQQFWGFSENPTKTEDEFEVEQFQGLINTINRVPFTSELADKGTAFNEVVDCIIEMQKSDKMQINVVATSTKSTIQAFYNNQNFVFDTDLCKEFAEYFKGALTQQRVSGIIKTKYGNVEVYGNLDELLPFKVADIKTTEQYTVGKYRKNWQHVVYPFCLIQSGNPIDEFEYVITDFKNTFIEHYLYKPEIDEPRLVEHCEMLIEFLLLNRELITDKKIFANE